MIRLLLAPIVAALLAGGSNCGTATTPGDPTAPDKIIAKRVPSQSSKNCWELRVAVDGRDDKVEIRCVDQATWNRYKTGDTYP